MAFDAKAFAAQLAKALQDATDGPSTIASATFLRDQQQRVNLIHVDNNDGTAVDLLPERNADGLIDSVSFVQVEYRLDI